jgi:hypothetical protein
MKMSMRAAWRRTRRNAAALTAAAVAATTPTIGLCAGAAGLYYERSVMTAAGERCRLFTPDVAAALQASRAQARGAALRAGSDAADLARLHAKAQQKAASVGCASPDMKMVAGRVRSAFEGYSKLYRMNFPGDVSSWRAERVAPADGPGWKLSQGARFGADRITFGMAGARAEQPRLAAAVLFADGARPYAARLVIRDVARTSAPYLGSARGGPTARLPLSSRVAPRTAIRAYLAESRSVDARLSPEPGKPAAVFRFPAAAANAIAALDPREAVSVEFLFAGRGGDAVRTAYLEVGDYAAAQAFLTIAQR